MADDQINQALGITPGHAGSDAGNPAINAAARYRKSYRAAGTAETVGLVLKIFGCVVTFLLFALIVSVTGTPWVTSRVDTTFLFFALLSSIMAGALFFALGVIVSALAQQLKANLDAAVNSSPFLDVPAKAKAMSL